VNLWHSTLKTTFDPKFNALAIESQYHALTTATLYNWQLERATKKHWTIHDLPIMVHEKLDTGHFYNKVLKDIINRYKLLKGFKIEFALGDLLYIIVNLTQVYRLQLSWNTD
jgi:isoleucyl-tRNA synthetase